MRCKFSSVMLAVVLTASFVGTTRAGIYKLTAAPSGTESVVIANGDLPEGKVLTAGESSPSLDSFKKDSAAQLWSIEDKNLKSSSGKFLQCDTASESNTLSIVEASNDKCTVFAYDGATGIKVTAHGGVEKYLNLENDVKVDASSGTVALYGKATNVTPVENKPISFGGKYLTVEGGKIELNAKVVLVDEAEYMENQILWTITEEGKVTPAASGEAAAIAEDELGVSFGSDPKLVAINEASVLQQAGDKWTVEGENGINQYINKTTLALENTATNAAVASTENVGTFDDSSTTTPVTEVAPNALEVSAKNGLETLEGAFRLVYYSSGKVAASEPYMIADTTGSINGTLTTSMNYPTAASTDGYQRWLPIFYWTYNKETKKLQNSRPDPKEIVDFVISVSPASYQTFEIEYGVDADGNPKNIFILKATAATDPTQAYVTTTDGKNFSLDTRDNATKFSALPTAYTLAATATDIGKSISLSFENDPFTDKHDGKNAGKELFNNLEVGAVAGTNDTIYVLRPDKDHLVVLDTTQNWNEKPTKAIIGGEDLGTPTGFRFDSIAVAKVDTADAKYYSYFTLYKADDGTEGEYIAKVSSNTGRKDSIGYLYVMPFNGGWYLTTSKDATAPVVIKAQGGATASKRIYAQDLLQGRFVNVEFVNTEYKKDATGNVDKDQKYKMGGLLAMLYQEQGGSAQADYITVDSLEAYKGYPEAQWAVERITRTGDSEPDKALVRLVNRENPDVVVDSLALDSVKVEINKDNVVLSEIVVSVDSAYMKQSSYKHLNVQQYDTLKITFVEKFTPFDGFLNTEKLQSLRDNVYKIAAYKAINKVNDGYWVEKDHSNTHQIGMDGDSLNAGKWNLYVDTLDGKSNYLEVKSKLYTWDDKKKAATPKDTALWIQRYAIQNDLNSEFVRYNDEKNREYLICDPKNKEFGDDNDASEEFYALKLRPEKDIYHIVRIFSDKLERKVSAGNAATKGALDLEANYTNPFNDLMKIVKDDQAEYRRFTDVATDAQLGLDTIKIFSDYESANVLYEKKDSLNKLSIIPGSNPEDWYSFLNLGNEVQFSTQQKDFNPALYVDTAYVDRPDNNRWQYLLAVDVNPDKMKGYWFCPDSTDGYSHNDQEWLKDHNGILDPETGLYHCPHAQLIKGDYVEGRYLVNLIDTAIAYDAQAQLHGGHGNPFINEKEAGNPKAKLAFVWARHFTNDSLVFYKGPKDWTWKAIPEDATVWGDTLDLNTPDLKIATFAFRYEDVDAQSFKIQTLYKDYNHPDVTSEEGYLRWENGTIVVDKGLDKGDVFNLEGLTGVTPTENESITATGNVIVAGVDGAVIVKGAEGKTVIVTTILGKVVANEVLTSDNATVAAPAGIVVVSVDGESYKVVVR